MESNITAIFRGDDRRIARVHILSRVSLIYYIYKKYHAAV